MELTILAGMGPGDFIDLGCLLVFIMAVRFLLRPKGGYFGR